MVDTAVSLFHFTGQGGREGHTKACNLPLGSKIIASRESQEFFYLTPPPRSTKYQIWRYLLRISSVVLDSYFYHLLISSDITDIFFYNKLRASMHSGRCKVSEEYL